MSLMLILQIKKPWGFYTFGSESHGIVLEDKSPHQLFYTDGEARARSFGILPELSMDGENVLDIETEDDITDDCVDCKEKYLTDSICIYLINRSGKFFCVTKSTVHLRF